MYIPINSQVREEIVHKVYLTDLRLQDEEYIQIGDYTEDNVVTFNHKHTANRPYEFPDNVHLQVTWELDLTQYRIDRDVYSVLDWIGDVGGLSEGLVILITIVLAIINFAKFDHFLIEHLYRKPAPSLFDSTDNGSGGSSNDDRTKKK